MKFFKILTTIFLLISSKSFGNISEECNQRLNSLPKDWKYGKFEVPLDWDTHKNSKKLEIYYYHLNDLKNIETHVPIIFINGGPTISSANGITAFGKIKKLENKNLILMDQRGTGCSSPFIDSELTPNLEFYKKYGAESIVKDAETLRKKLFGTRKWKVYGQSFGGFTSFRYLELFPQSIHSAHIHGFGFSEKPENFLDARETRLKELTEEILNFSNPQVSTKTIGDIRNILLNNENLESRNFYKNLCIPLKTGENKKICGPDVFSGLFLVLGFRNMWPFAHKNLFQFSELLESKKYVELESAFRKFMQTYILRFNNKNQAIALNMITYNELIPGRFFYDGCSKVQENEIFSECRFTRSFLDRLPSRPTFKPDPVRLNKVKRNIEKYKIPVYYYAGAYDTFIPTHFLEWTAQRLGIQDSLTVFPESGHEGYYSEDLVIDNLINSTN